MDASHLGELIAVLFSVGMVLAYHAFLRIHEKRDPTYTIQAVLNVGRLAWVARMMDAKEGVLAVQTLRNAIMGATFFASTAVVLIIGTLTLTAHADQLAEAWHALSPSSEFAQRTWLIKLLVLLVDLLYAFICFTQTIRLLSHVGFLISAPVEKVTPSTVCRILIQSGRYHTRGMRCYYYATPMLFWLFGPSFLVVATCGLVASLYYLDKAPLEAPSV